MVAYDTPVICSIIKRTLFNLEFIEKHKTQYGLFEVTQLLNSIAGVLVYPKESLIECVEKSNLTDEECPVRGISQPKVLYGKLNSDTVHGLIHYLRNGFAHFNTDFEYEDKQIKGVYVWNKEHGKTNWVAYMSISTLRHLIEDISNLFLEASKKTSDKSTPLEKVERELKKCLRITSCEGRQ
jgi:hypothetical protein